VTEFGILGTLVARREGRELDLGGRKQRAVLALLLLRANRVVSIERLSEDLYAGDPPASAVTQVHRQVSELRKIVDADAIETRPPGYVIRVAPDALDLHRFERLTERAASSLDSGDARAAVAELDEALALWRGPALADLVYEPFAQAPIARLEELRMAAVERRFTALLALGRHADLVGELRELAAEHPLRERIRELLMLALYGSGRQVEALEVYRETRTQLVESFGVEPGPELQHLEAAILRQDPELDPPQARHGATRGLVLVAGRDEARLGTLLDVVEPLAARAERELLVTLLVEDEARLGEAAEGLEPVRRRLGAGGRAAAFVSSRGSDDVLHLVRSHDPELVVIEGRPDELERPDADLAGVLEGTLADVAIAFAPTTAAPPGGGVLVPFGGGEHDWGAVELGAWLAAATGERLRLAGARANPRRGGHDASRLLADASLAVQRVVGVAAEPVLAEPTAGGLADAADGASLVVIGLSPRWRQHGLGEARRRLVADPACPVLVVHSGMRPSGIAPREAATRFTWSIADG
jgi:DNA-binding SARP family transcriptional activator